MGEFSVEDFMGEVSGRYSLRRILGVVWEEFLRDLLRGMSGGIFWGESPYSRAGLQVSVSSGWDLGHPAQCTDRQL